MRSANHDQAVQLLTDTQRFVRIVVEREVKGPLEPPQSPRSPLLKGLSPTGYMANRPSKIIFISCTHNNETLINNIFFFTYLYIAYTGYRRSIGDILETSNCEATNKSNPQTNRDVVDVENHKLASTEKIITHQNTSSTAMDSEAFIKNEKDAQIQQAPPRPAPRSLSTQNSIPLTNGNGKSDDSAQVRYEHLKTLSYLVFL